MEECILQDLRKCNIKEENINSIQKAVSLVEELTKETKKEETSTPKESKIDNLYGDKDE